MSRRTRLLTAVGALVAAATFALVVAPAEPAAVITAQHALRSNEAFASGPAAARAMAKISHALLLDGKACVRAHGDRDPRCTGRLSAAGFGAVAAFQLVGCTQPEVVRVRAGMIAELDAVRALDAHRRATPEVPVPPSC